MCTLLFCGAKVNCTLDYKHIDTFHIAVHSTHCYTSHTAKTSIFYGFVRNVEMFWATHLFETCDIKYSLVLQEDKIPTAFLGQAIVYKF